MYSVRGDSFIGSTLGSCDRLSAGAPRTEVTYPMSVFGSESAELSPCVTPPAERASRKRTEKSKQGVECDDRAPRRRTLPSRSHSESNCVIRRVSDRLATENSPCSTASRGTKAGDWCTRSGRPPASGGRPSRQICAVCGPWPASTRSRLCRCIRELPRCSYNSRGSRTPRGRPRTGAVRQSSPTAARKRWSW
jgi:hypothetical protein